MALPPLVAVGSYHLAAERVKGWAVGGFAVQDVYVEAVRRAGLRPVILPYPDPLVAAGQAGEALEAFAGLVMVGGGDIDPARYGEARDQSCYGIDAERDAEELALGAAAVAMGLPLFAICRGLQAVNVALGGTLVQDLPEEHGERLHGRPVDGLGNAHAVSVTPGSRLSQAVDGRPTIEACASYHHQAVARLAPGLAVSARGADGVVEAVEPADPAAPWMLAVQWHPERTAATDPVQQRLFDAFGDAVRVALSARAG